jgi:formylglycine-generating enzyme required for sulfatase activity
MPTTLAPSLPHGTAALAASLALLLPLACTDMRPTERTQDVSPVPPPTLLVVDLPAGIEVTIDGGQRRAAPFSPIEIEPGTHTLRLVTACQELDLPIDVPAGSTTRIDRDRAAGLELAALEVTALGLDGKPLVHSVAIGDTVAGEGEGPSKVDVPACRHRVTVASEGLGAFIEDIDFGEQARVERELVLSPGPAMVRIHGGRFTLGPPEGFEERWKDEEGYLIFPRIPVEVETFDLDRTEVTATQWHECRAAAQPQRCYSESDCEDAVGCPDRVYLVTHFPSERKVRLCNADIIGVDRAVGSGKAEHPMNCVARWEADDYCRWVGKRLPSAIEWEYAARSGDDRTLWPWGNDDVSCTLGAWERASVHGDKPSGEPCNREGTAPVCSVPAGNSKQGVCDLAGNVAEYVGRAEIAGTSRRPDDYATLGSSWQYSYEEPFHYAGSFTRHSLEVDVGFRCARAILNERSR